MNLYYFAMLNVKAMKDGKSIENVFVFILSNFDDPGSISNQSSFQPRWNISWSRCGQKQN